MREAVGPDVEVVLDGGVRRGPCFTRGTDSGAGALSLTQAGQAAREASMAQRAAEELKRQLVRQQLISEGATSAVKEGENALTNATTGNPLVM